MISTPPLFYPFLSLQNPKRLDNATHDYTYLATKHSRHLVQPRLRIQHLSLQHLFRQVIDMADLATLDIGREEVDGLAERLADGRGGREHLGVAAHAEDADVEVVVGVLGEELLDFVRDLYHQLRNLHQGRECTQDDKAGARASTYHFLISSKLGLLLRQQLLLHFFEFSLELGLFDQADAGLAELLLVSDILHMYVIGDTHRQERLHGRVLLLALQALNTLELALKLDGLTRDFVRLVAGYGDDTADAFGNGRLFDHDEILDRVSLGDVSAIQLLTLGF